MKGLLIGFVSMPLICVIGDYYRYKKQEKHNKKYIEMLKKYDLK